MLDMPVWTRRLLVAVLAVVLLIGYTWALHDVFTSRFPGANDFYPRYAAAHLMLREGVNPYSRAATDWIQDRIYGGTTPSSPDFHSFAYPLYSILLAAPYLLLPDYAWAQAAWQVTLQVLLVITVILILKYIDWQPPRWLLVLICLWSVLSYSSARAIILGQFSILVFFLTILAFWLLLRGEASPQRDVAAGICLAVSTVKPQMQFLIIPLLVLWALRSRRWYFLGSAALSMAALAAVSFAMLPSWPADWLQQVLDYSAYTPPSVAYILTHEIAGLGAAAQWALRIVLMVYLLAEWVPVLRDPHSPRLDWVLALTLVITHFLAPRTATTHYLVFLFAYIPLLRMWQARHSILPVGFMLIMSISEWWLFATTTIGDAEANIMFIPQPLIVLALLLLARPAAERFAQPPPRAAEPAAGAAA